MYDLRLKNGSKVAIIGGGPAGASCAIKLKQLSEKLNLSLRIVLYEGKDFDYLYNQCVGVLSPPFQNIMRENLNLEIPPDLIKRIISGYTLFGYKEHIKFNNAISSEPTYVVRRIKFDNFMLEYAKSIGVEVVKSRTTYVEFIINNNHADEVRIFGERGYLTADVVVGAFGLDEAMLGVFESATRYSSGYKRPKKFLRSYITKIFVDKRFIDRKLGDNIYAFIPSAIPTIEFGAVTPKGGYIMVNIAGKYVTSQDIYAFLNLPIVKQLLPSGVDYSRLDFFEGMFPVSPATNPFGDRFVAVGDATGWMRPFKGKGINTALITGIRAAETIIYHGVSREAFKLYAARCKELRDDYYCGMVVRYITHIFSKLGLFDCLIKVAKNDIILYNALYNSVSGHDSYRHILKDLLNVSMVKKVGSTMCKKVIGVQA